MESLRPAFPTFSLDPRRGESLRLAFHLSLHLVLNLNVGKVFALLSHFSTFSAESERKESLPLAFTISLHLVLALNVGKVFVLLSLFPYI